MACFSSHLGPDCLWMTLRGNRPFLTIILGTSRYHKSPYINALQIYPNIQEPYLKFSSSSAPTSSHAKHSNNHITWREVVLKQVFRKGLHPLYMHLNPWGSKSPEVVTPSIARLSYVWIFKHKYVTFNLIPFQQIMEN